MKETEQELLNTLAGRITQDFDLGANSKVRCACCKSEPEQIPSLKAMAEVESTDLEEYAKEDGTYSKDLNAFICDDCFHKYDAPSIRANLIDGEYSSRVGKLTVIEICLNNMNGLHS